jgi:hypothetical protein
MSFYLHKSQLVPKRAAKTLRCFQVLVVPNPYHCPHPLLIDQAIEEGAFFSFTTDFKYVSGVAYTDSMWGYESPKYFMSKQRLYGFSSYASLASVINNRNSEVYDEVIVEFEIPEGSQYYYNPDTDQYFSESIKCIGHYPLWKAMFGVILHPIRSIATVI